MTNDIEYDVGLSYASEQRYYVEPIAEFLRERGVKVFYDQFEIGTIWGKNVNDWFYEIFNKKIKYSVIFISESYVRKANTYIEYQAMLQKQKLLLGQEYILPVYFDDSRLAPLEGIGFVKASEITPEKLAILIWQKTLDIHIVSKQPITTSDEFLSILESKLQNNIHITTERKNNTELLIQVNSKINYSVLFKVGGLLFNDKKIEIYENFENCLSPGGILSGIIELNNNSDFVLENCGFINDGNMSTFSIDSFFTVLFNKLSEVRHICS